MMKHHELSLAQQREQIRAQMHAQREIIAIRLAQAEVHDNAYPRSMLMRLLTQRPVTTALAKMATVFLGAKLIRSLDSAKIVMGLFRNLRKGKSAMAA